MHIYLIMNLINSKQYIGAEKGNDSNYFGSGRLIIEAIEKFGKQNFKKEILIDDKHIDNWEECLTLESACILSLNTLRPDGYNISLWNWPIPIEILRAGGRKTFEEKRGMFDPANEEIMRESRIKAGKISAEMNKKQGTAIFAPGMQSEGGKITGYKNLRKWIKKHPEKFLESISKGGKENVRRKSGLFDPANKEKCREGCRKGGKIGSKMRAYALFEIDGLIQRMTLGAISGI